MRRIAILGFLAAALLVPAAPAAAETITNGTVTLGVNPQGNLNSADELGFFGVTYNPTQNDGTRDGNPWEGWGAGAGGASPFEARANQSAGNDGYRQVSFTSTADRAMSVVDILRGESVALRLRQDFHPSPTTPNLYEITTTLENLSGGPLTDVRYERAMDWDVEPTSFNEFVTVNRGASPPAALIYSDDNGFSDSLPFTFAADGDGPLDPLTVDADYADRGPYDHGARFTFSFGTLAAGEQKQFFLYYGAAGDEPSADAAVSAAALEVFSYGQPSVPDGPDADTLPDGQAQGKPNTFVWGFRAVGGRPAIPPTLTVSPESASKAVGDSHTVTARLTDSSGDPVPGARLVGLVSGAHSLVRSGTTDANGQASTSYTGTGAGDDVIKVCLDSNANGGCDGGEVTDTATASWAGPAPTPTPTPQQQVAGTTQTGPEPVLNQTVVAGAVSGTIRVKGRDGRFRTLGADEAIPLGSTVDATKGRVKLTSAAGPGGATQSAVFYQGLFKVTQTRGSKPVTQLALTGALSCAKSGAKARGSQRRRRVRRLWGDGSGRFRTRGRHGAATVRGTKWLTEDRCDGTRVRVSRGRVAVRDFARRKTIVVKQGKSYTARPKSRRR